LEWDKIQPGTVGERNVSAIKCSFSKTEKDINETLNILKMISGNADIKRCLSLAVPLICNVVYRNCGTSSELPPAEYCLHVKNDVCQHYWDIAVGLLNSNNKEVGICLTMPDCEKDFPHVTKLPGWIGRDNFTLTFNSSGNCTKPLVQTEIYNPDFPLTCSPPCLDDDWCTKSEFVGLNAVLYVTVIFTWICCIVTFITWAGVPELRRFPEVTPLFLIISYAVAAVGVSLPVLIGRHRAYCNHEDAFSIMMDPSTVCRIQGMLVHFGFMSAIIWWLCSIFNAFIVVYSGHPDNPIVSHPKFLFFIEFLVSIVVPASIVSVVLLVGGTYSTFSVQIVLCGPPTTELMYFTLSLPLQFIVFIGSILMGMIVIRLRKNGKNTFSRTSSHVYKAMEKRFLLIIIFFPLCFGTILASISAYERVFKDMMLSYMKYAYCIDHPTPGKECVAGYRKYRSVTTAIVDLCMFDIFNIILMISTLLPGSARQFWKKHLNRIVKCDRKPSEIKK
jgi:hypothetical protein